MANNRADSRLTAVVLVMGDVGRSPRMQYHALSLANAAQTRRIFLVGYRGERAVPAVEENAPGCRSGVRQEGPSRFRFVAPLW